MPNPKTTPSKPRRSVRRLFRNAVTEKDIRDWLSRNDYYAGSAEFHEVELHAIQRPGWLQVFRFSLRAKNRISGEWVELHGVVRDDERYRKTEIETFIEFADRDQRLHEWSQGLIMLRRRLPRENDGTSWWQRLFRRK